MPQPVWITLGFGVSQKGSLLRQSFVEYAADRVYDHDTYRRLLRDRSITPRSARRGVAPSSGLGEQRWVVERGFAWLHVFKRLRTRYEHRADIHLGLLQLACVLICYRQLPVVLKRVPSDAAGSRQSPKAPDDLPRS